MSHFIHLKKWAFILFIFGSALAGCQKMNDYVHFPFKGDTEFKLCDIRQVVVTSDNPGEFVTHYSFNYNKKGDPVTVINDGITPNLWFKYDKSGRLSELIRPYNNGFFETWSKYGYNNRNQIILDSQYWFGEFIDSVPILAEFSKEIRIYRFEYDQQNRIISETDTIYNSGIFTVAYHLTYDYDNKGNLINGLTYDNKVSIFRTNKIWMFLKRDYSVNNSFAVNQYNPYGLPEKFHADFATLGTIVPLAGNDQVEYSCH